MALNINGRMKVKTLKSDFKKKFGLNIRVYTGREFADDDATLASIRKGDAKGGEFSPARNTKVGNLEDKILDMFGLKTQISGSDDSYLCENDHTLAKALEVNEKLMVKRSKRDDKSTMKESTEEVSLGDIGKEYNEFEQDMYDEYNSDNVLLIRDWFSRYLAEYAEGYKDLILENSKAAEYETVQEWLDDGNLDLFPTDLKLDIGYAQKALQDMKQIAENWIEYLASNNNMAPGPNNAEQIIPSRFFNDNLSTDAETSNENNNVSTDTEVMSIEEIIDEVKKLYSGHEDFEDMIEDLENGIYFNLWSSKLKTDEFGNNIKLANALRKI